MAHLSDIRDTALHIEQQEAIEANMVRLKLQTKEQAAANLKPMQDTLQAIVKEYCNEQGMDPEGFWDWFYGC